MSITTAALMTAIGYFVPYTWNWYHGQCMTERPIVVGTCVGALLGDIKLGVICGAELEAIYMGVVNIGGAMAAETVSATAIATAFVVYAGLDLDTALTTVAVPVGLAFNVLRTPLNMIGYAFLPYWKGLIAKGDYKAIKFFQLWEGLFIKLIWAAIIFVCVRLGAEPLTNVLASIPQWLMHGFSVASGLLGAVGMAVLLKMLWSNELASYYFLGFTMFKYLGLPLIAICVFGVCIIIPIALRDMELKNMSVAGGEKNEEEDFFA